MTVALIILGYLVGYIMTVPVFNKAQHQHCQFDRHGVSRDSNDKMVYQRCWEYHLPGSVVGSVMWPMLLPGATAYLMFKREPVGRKERTRQNELELAKHKLKLAEIQNKTTKELEQALERGESN